MCNHQSLTFIVYSGVFIVDRKAKKLVQQLKSDSTKERYLAVLELGRTGDTELIPHIDKVATLDANPKVRKLATQAVRALKTIKQKEDEEVRQAQIAVLDAEDEAFEIEPGSLGWGSIDDLIVEKEPDENSSDWNYHQLGKKHQEDKAQREADEAAMKKRRRWRYRRFLWVCTLIVVTGLVFVAYDRINTVDEPESREEALDRLEVWFDEVIDTSNSYSRLIQPSASAVDCAEFKDNNAEYIVPVRPDWAGPDKAHQEDLDDFFTALEFVENNLTNAFETVEGLCDDKDDAQAWTDEYPNPFSTLGATWSVGYFDQARTNFTNARLVLDAEKAAQDAEDEAADSE